MSTPNNQDPDSSTAANENDPNGPKVVMHKLDLNQFSKSLNGSFIIPGTGTTATTATASSSENDNEPMPSTSRVATDAGGRTPIKIQVDSDSDADDTPYRKPVIKTISDINGKGSASRGGRGKRGGGAAQRGGIKTISDYKRGGKKACTNVVASASGARIAGFPTTSSTDSTKGRGRGGRRGRGGGTRRRAKKEDSSTSSSDDDTFQPEPKKSKKVVEQKPIAIFEGSGHRLCPNLPVSPTPSSTIITQTNLITVESPQRLPTTVTLTQNGPLSPQSQDQREKRLAAAAAAERRFKALQSRGFTSTEAAEKAKEKLERLERLQKVIETAPTPDPSSTLKWTV